MSYSYDPKIDLIEIKVRYVGDAAAWEDIPVSFRFAGNKTEADRFATQLALRMVNVVEVRWNVAGSFQGRYVGTGDLS